MWNSWTWYFMGCSRGVGSRRRPGGGRSGVGAGTCRRGSSDSTSPVRSLVVVLALQLVELLALLDLRGATPPVLERHYHLSEEATGRNLVEESIQPLEWIARAVVFCWRGLHRGLSDHPDMDFGECAGQGPALLLAGERATPESVSVPFADLFALRFERRLARRREPPLDAVEIGR